MSFVPYQPPPLSLLTHRAGDKTISLIQGNTLRNKTISRIIQKLYQDLLNGRGKKQKKSEDVVADDSFTNDS
jgi:hypothetical protein